MYILIKVLFILDNSSRSRSDPYGKSRKGAKNKKVPLVTRHSPLVVYLTSNLRSSNERQETSTQ
ncbi:MAG: hypothetical protein KAT07_10140 [Calditrichia bacterium]|nr:hypothetical protein [Calditrichia bacterium]